MAGFCLRAHPLQNTQKKNPLPSAKPAQGCAQNSFSHLKYHPLGNHRRLLHNHLHSTSASFFITLGPQAPFWSLHVGAPPLTDTASRVRGWGLPPGYAASRAQWSTSALAHPSMPQIPEKELLSGTVCAAVKDNLASCRSLPGHVSLGCLGYGPVHLTRPQCQLAPTGELGEGTKG